MSERPAASDIVQSAIWLGGAREVPVPRLPTQCGPRGIRFDFNEGCRVAVPAGRWRVQLRDLATHNVLFDQIVDDGMVASAKKYFIRFGIRVWSSNGELVLERNYDATNERVLVRMEVGGLGDQIAWVGHAIAFARKYRCQLTCGMRAAVIPLFRENYPDVEFATVDEIDPTAYYATYKVFIFYNDHGNAWQPVDYRTVGLANIAAYILGMPVAEQRPRVTVAAGGPPLPGPYVCIATQASSQNKYWNNPLGWSSLIRFLHGKGYEVVCIDQKTVNGSGQIWNQIPHGVRDETGDRPLTERALWLRHAAFFVGLSSGLSWLAWAVETPVVLVSGFTHPVNEFHTPYRVINYNVCNSCSNDVRQQLDPSDFMWCPRKVGTDHMFECSRLITAEHVQDVIKTIPGFQHEARQFERPRAANAKRG